MSYHHEDNQYPELYDFSVYDACCQSQQACRSGATAQQTRKRKMARLALLLAVLIAVSGITGAGAAWWTLNCLSSQTGYPAAGDTMLTTANLTAIASAESDIISVVRKAADNVVEISTEIIQYSPFAGEFVTKGAGSGVIVTTDGYIVTNNHVISGARTIRVRTNDGKEYAAALVAQDADTDLAVLRIEAFDLTAATFADSSAVQVGQLAVAIGNPLGSLGGTVTEGIISAKDREITIDGQTLTLIQTSAAVNPGNSGGGLFDKNGNLVGIVNAKSSGSDIEGLAFAIPANTVMEVVDQLIESGYVTGRPQLGISVTEISNAQAAARYGVSEFGVYIRSASAGSGLAVGDRILSLDDTAISSIADLSRAVGSYQVGGTVKVKVSRNGQEITVPVTLTERVPDNARRQAS